MFPHFAVYFLHNLRMLSQVQLRILTALTDLAALVRIPCSALINDIDVRSQIQNITFPGNALSEHDIELCLFKWRRNLILHDTHTGAVTDDLSALL